MAKGYKETEYMYSSARIRALENKLVGREDMMRLADAEDVKSVISAMDSYGFEPVYGSSGEFLREDTLMRVLERGFADVLEMECAPAVRFLQYQYDCNNIKAIIKCAARNISPDAMLLPIGTVSPDEAKTAFANKDYSKYPDCMKKAIPEAEGAFAATANPQKIDFIIDKACMADMLNTAKKTGIPLAKKLAEAKIDLVNIMQAIRISRMGLVQEAESLVKEVYIDGGTVDKKRVINAVYDMDEFLKELRRGQYDKLEPLVSSGASLAELERKVDNIYFDIAKDAKWVPFGAEVAIGYIFALEYEIKNIRLVLAGKEAGLSPATIKERLRESYV